MLDRRNTRYPDRVNCIWLQKLVKPDLRLVTEANFGPSLLIFRLLYWRIARCSLQKAGLSRSWIMLSLLDFSPASDTAVLRVCNRIRGNF